MKFELQDEYIELYNSNDFEVNLTGWTLEDANGTIKVFLIPENTIISATGILTFKRTETKIMLNNDADTVVLKNPNGKIAGSLSFEKAKLGQTYPAKTGSLAKESLPKKEKSDTNDIAVLPAQAGLANISQGFQNQDIKNANPWFLFFTALSITIISALAVLFIKFKLKPKN